MTRHLSRLRNKTVRNARSINWQRLWRRPGAPRDWSRLSRVPLTPVCFCNKDSVGIWFDKPTNKWVSVNPPDCLRNDRGFASLDGLFMHPDRGALLTDGQTTLVDLVQVSVVGSSADEVVISPADFISNVTALLSTTPLTRGLTDLTDLETDSKEPSASKLTRTPSFASAIANLVLISRDSFAMDNSSSCRISSCSCRISSCFLAKWLASAMSVAFSRDSLNRADATEPDNPLRTPEDLLLPVLAQ